MVDWLVTWGVAQAVGFVFKPILEDLAKEAAKDYAKDFFKDCLKKVIRLPEKNVQKEAYGKALVQFLQFFQQELDDADYQEAEIKLYLKPLEKFVKQEKVAAILGSAFEVDCTSLNTHFLARTWQDLKSPFLPDQFDWERVSKRYLKKVKAIVQESDKLRPIFAVQTQSEMAKGIEEIAGIAPDFNLGRYAEGLQEQYGGLKLDSLDTTGVYYQELRLWNLFIPQNIRECQELLPPEIPKEVEQRLVKEGQLEKSQLTDEERDKRHQVYMSQPMRLVWEILGDPTVGKLSLTKPVPSAVILGDPGSGKSSLLQYLALSWAQRPIRDLSLFPIPLLIELRFYGRDKQAAKKGGRPFDFLSFLHGGNVTCHLNQQTVFDKLNAGQGIALFDGIDEVFDPALRDEVVKDIHRFSNQFKRVRIIVTSRRLGYKAQLLRDAGFKHFMLQDLEIEQIQEFIERWHELISKDEADKLRKKERLLRAIRESKSIRELAGNPLLLTMMAILNRNQELPRDRPELYNQASRVLLHQWDVERALVEDARIDPKTFDYRDKQAMLRKVAFRMQSSEKGLAGNVMSAADLEKELTGYLRDKMEFDKPKEIARVLIHQLRTRNFVLCELGADCYGFVHRTFLEFFCAWEFVWQFKEEQTLTIEELITEVFDPHWQDESWHEVLRLICGMIEPKFVADIIDFLLEKKVDIKTIDINESLKKNYLKKYDRGDYFLQKEGLNSLILATNCFMEVRNKKSISATSDKLLTTLKDEVNQVSEPWFGSKIWFDQELANLFISLIATVGQEDPDTLPWLKDRALQDEDEDVRYAAVNTIAEGWKEDPDTLPWLKDLALHSEQFNVRFAAVKAIVEGWKEDPDTLPLLKDRALQDEDYPVREAAVNAIVEGWKEDPDTLPLLKDRALQDEDYSVRQAAVNAIVEGWKEDPDTLSLLKDRALHEEFFYMREAAVEAIAEGWKEDPDTLPWLKDHALYDEDKDVQKAAVKGIVEGWKEDPDTLPWLKDLALQDADETVREVAVNAIAEGWKEDPDTLPWLKDRALQDEDYKVRYVAVNAIAEEWKEDPDTLPWLKDRALQDEDEDVRQAAVEAIAQGWKEDPQLLEFLSHIALNDPFKRDYDFQDNPSQTALKALLENFRDNPKILEILNQIACKDSDKKLQEFAVKKSQEIKKSNS